MAKLKGTKAQQRHQLRFIILGMIRTLENLKGKHKELFTEQELREIDAIEIDLKALTLLMKRK